MPSVLAGRAETQTVVAVYLVIGIGYMILRIVRYARDREESRESATA